jgi:hypothetical protein
LKKAVSKGSEVADGATDIVEEEKSKVQNFAEMIDNLLSKVDPAQFVKLVEKLNGALPPPGQEVLRPFMEMLVQACEVKAQIEAKIKSVMPNRNETAVRIKGSVGIVQARGSDQVLQKLCIALQHNHSSGIEVLKGCPP